MQSLQLFMSLVNIFTIVKDLYGVYFPVIATDLYELYFVLYVLFSFDETIFFFGNVMKFDLIIGHQILFSFSHNFYGGCLVTSSPGSGLRD